MAATTTHAAQSYLKPASFNKTIRDISFKKRTQIYADGYKPYNDVHAYDQLDIDDKESAIAILTRAEADRQNDLNNLSPEEYCNKYPLDTNICPQNNISDTPAVTTTQTQTPAPTQKQTPAPTQTVLSNKTCTPPQRSQFFSNEIKTTGRYAQSDPAFEKAMITLFRVEGGYNPDDNGSPSNMGIRQKDNPDVDIKNLTHADVENIAHKKYYSNYNINNLPTTTRGNVFLQTYNSGPSALKRFRRFLGLKESVAKLTDDDIAAAKNYSGDIHNDFLDKELEFYQKLSEKAIKDKKGNYQYDKNGNIITYKIYLNSWIKRIKILRENGCHTPTTDPIYR